MDKVLLRRIAAEYFRQSGTATVVAIIAFAFAAGVLAAILNVYQAVSGTEIGERVVQPISLNAAISWSIAAFFCLPLMVGRAFSQVDYLAGCLKIVRWPVRRHFVLVLAQFIVIFASGGILSVPIAIAAQSLFARIPRRDTPDLLYPPELYQSISASSILIALGVALLFLVVALLNVMRKYVVGNIRRDVDPRPIKVHIQRPKIFEWIDVLFVIGVGSLIISFNAGIQAGLFVVIGFSVLYLWACTRWTLFGARGIERMLAAGSRRIPLFAAMGALLAEMHQSLRAIALPATYVIGIPSILLSISRTEAIALRQEGGGVQTWDFLVMLGLPLLYVGFLSVNSFIATTNQIGVTSQRLGELGMSEMGVSLARFVGLPTLLVGIAFVSSTFIAVIGSAFHVLLLSSNISIVQDGINLTVSSWLGATLLAVFLLSGAVLLLAKKCVSLSTP